MKALSTVLNSSFLEGLKVGLRAVLDLPEKPKLPDVEAYLSQDVEAISLNGREWRLQALKARYLQGTLPFEDEFELVFQALAYQRNGGVVKKCN